MAYGTRTFLELSVGGTHSIELLVHLRSADLSWWNSNLTGHQAQLFKIVGRQILPNRCSEEIERYHQKRKQTTSDVIIGKKSLPPGASKGSKRKMTAKSGLQLKKKKDSKQSKSSAVIEATKEHEEVNDKITRNPLSATPTRAATRDVSYLFGDSIQVTYEMEELRSESLGATLLYTNKKNIGDGNVDTDNQAEGLATFRQLPKLRKRITVWCFAFDPSHPTEPIPEGGGFPRPELVPISNLFMGIREGG